VIEPERCGGAGEAFLDRVLKRLASSRCQSCGEVNDQPIDLCQDFEHQSSRHNVVSVLTTRNWPI